MDRQEIMLLLQRLRAFSTPELCDGAGLYHSMDYRIKPQISSEKIVGTAVTVDVPTGEGAMVAQAIHHPWLCSTSACLAYCSGRWRR